nr:hypothetical protein [uncultured Flavobacterium sp.]
MKIEDLKQNVEKLYEAWKTIDEKRDNWRSEKKKLIKETLSEIKNTYDLDWNIYVVDFTTNSEGVNITFGKSSSGIFESNHKGSKSYTKHGGTLTFSQAYNGDIFVIILYPSVEQFVTPKDGQENKLVEKINPIKIDKEYIIKQVDNFLKEMRNWENSDSSNSPLGFKN